MRQHGNWRLRCRQEPSWQISRNWSGTTAVNPPRSTRIKSKAMSNSILSAIYSTGWSASLRQVKSSRAAEKWENKDNTVWTFHLRPALRSDGTPSPRKILSGAGSGWSTRKPPPYASYPGSMRIVNGTDIAEGKKRPSRWGESHQ